MRAWAPGAPPPSMPARCRCKPRPHPGERVGFIAQIEELSLETVVPAAKVVINARTGSVVLNQAVTLGPCAVAHAGNLSIIISSRPIISQPNPLSQGQTVVSQQSDIQINQEPGNIIQMPPSAQLTDVVRALNALGATPGDLLAILQAPSRPLAPAQRRPGGHLMRAQTPVAAEAPPKEC